MGSGSEVQLLLGAHGVLSKGGITARVVNMPSWELFEAQPADYRKAVLPPDISARLAVEAAAPLGWERYTGIHGHIMGMDRFGASAPGKAVFEKFGFTVHGVVQKAKELMAFG